MERIRLELLSLAYEATQLHWAVPVSLVLCVLLAALAMRYLRLRTRFAETEAELLERTISVHSRNWTSTAMNLEKKAQEPGGVARSSALTYLHLLDEAAEAWLKGSQWQDALRVTQQLLVECCHAIGNPGFGENEFRAAADIVELRMSNYAELSMAASEAPENAIRFIHMLDRMLSVIDQAPRVVHLRDMFEAAHHAITSELEDVHPGRAHGH